MTLQLVIAVLVTSLVDLPFLRFAFRWPWPKAAGTSLLMNAVSYLVSSILLSVIVARMPPSHFQLDYVAAHFAALTFICIVPSYLVQVATETVVCRYSGAPSSLPATVGLLAACNLLTTLMAGCVAIESRPTIAPPFSTAVSADWLATNRQPIVFLDIRCGQLARSFAGTSGVDLVSSAVPVADYRTSLDATRFTLCTRSGIVAFAWAPLGSTAPVELTLPVIVTNAALASLSPDHRWCAVASTGTALVFAFPSGVQTAAVAVSGVVPLEYLCWDADSTALVAGNASTAARVDWLHGSSAITTQALAGLDVSSLPVIRPALTTRYARADASVTVDLLGGITVAAPALQGTFRASRRAMYIGLGFSDDGSSFLFFLLTSFSKGIYALNLGSGAVGYVNDGIAAVLPGSGVRVPALPPPASP